MTTLHHVVGIQLRRGRGWTEHRGNVADAARVAFPVKCPPVLLRRLPIRSHPSLGDGPGVIELRALSIHGWQPIITRSIDAVGEVRSHRPAESDAGRVAFIYAGRC